MGLDISHDAFHGAYSAFDRFRRLVAQAAGVRWPPHHDPTLDDESCYWIHDEDYDRYPGLTLFFGHSDCDGEFSATEAALVADDLERLLPRIGAMDDGGSKQILAQGGYAAVTRRFIAGCRAAALAGESLLFE